MRWLNSKFRRFENIRRKEIIHDFRHLNCGDCWNHRTNHAPTMVLKALGIGITLFVLMIIGLYFGIPYLGLAFIMFLFASFLILGHYMIPPHKREFYNLLIKKRKRTVD